MTMSSRFSPASESASTGTTFDALLKNAEAAMYRAKALGRGGYQFYSPEMSARANERVLFEGELHRALLREQFELHFQPQIEISTGDLIGVEALVRWQHPELGWLQPARFIPIAEETGLIGPLGRYVLREACVQSCAWRDQGMPTVPVAVNISAAQLRHADFLTMVREIIAETGIDPKTLELEITEGTMMEVTEPLLARVDSLKQLGVRLSIDDFGTGYSNLAYLRTFPLDRLKIDQSFIASAPHDEGSQSIVRAILGLGESLGLEVVAEGVETAEQAALLGKLGCRNAQGYLYGRPMPASHLVAWAAARYGSGRRQAGGPIRLV
jgi:EAL domain-containing protein (putative c-di-GMP-specific phosphodiesterase class I)